MKYEEFLALVAENIRRLRAEKGLTQEDMDFGEFGIPVPTYTKIEQGRNKDVKLSSLFTIAKRLGVEPYELLYLGNDVKLTP